MSHAESSVETEWCEKRIDILLVGHQPAGTRPDILDNVISLGRYRSGGIGRGGGPGIVRDNTVSDVGGCGCPGSMKTSTAYGRCVVYKRTIRQDQRRAVI